MLKETLISLFSIILIVVGNNVTQNYAKETMDDISNQLQELRQIETQEEVNNEEAKSKADEIYNNWEEKYTKLAYFIEHDELEKVEDGLTQIRSNIEVEQHEEATVQLDSTMFILSHIEDKLSFKLENIF